MCCYGPILDYPVIVSTVNLVSPRSDTLVDNTAGLLRSPTRLVESLHVWLCIRQVHLCPLLFRHLSCRPRTGVFVRSGTLGARVPFGFLNSAIPFNVYTVGYFALPKWER
jgi:hypothetical protein